jgi:AraC family transcriptional regulator
MLLTQFPDLQWLKRQAEDGFSNRKSWGGQTLPSGGWPTVILNVQTNQTYRDNIRGPLSIFSNLKGESEVETDKRKVKIKPDYFFVSNHDQHYTLGINKTETETFNIHFGEYFADEVFTSLHDHPGRLLDDHYFTAPHERIELYNKLFYKSEQFSTLIKAIQNNSADKLLREENLYKLLCILLEENKEIKKRTAQLPSIKNSTREEIIRRLLYSVDYIHSHYEKDLSLEELASVACFSKFHFLRLFKIVFGKTPHQFINQVKVEKAKRVLKQTSYDVTLIARNLGFDTASSFSRMFYNQVGVYPSQYRG